jgi:hypothetical protein
MAEPLRVITQTESWKAEVRADVVETLRELLQRAEAGEIQGIAYSCATIDRGVSTGFTKSDNHNAIIGGLARVQYRMLADEEE